MCNECAFHYDLGRNDERQMRDAEIAKWKESCAALADTIKGKDAEIERLRKLADAQAEVIRQFNMPTMAMTGYRGTASAS